MNEAVFVAPEDERQRTPGSLGESFSAFLLLLFMVGDFHVHFLWISAVPSAQVLFSFSLANTFLRVARYFSPFFWLTALASMPRCFGFCCRSNAPQARNGCFRPRLERIGGLRKTGETDICAVCTWRLTTYTRRKCLF